MPPAIARIWGVPPMHRRAFVAFLFGVVASALLGCGAAVDLPGARRALSSSELVLVKELTHADGDQALQIRSTLAAAAPPQAREAVRAGEVVEGMAAVDALRAWGQPDSAWRPWLLTDGRSECWEYRARDLPRLQLWFENGSAHQTWYRVENIQPDVPKGTIGWLKRWPSREELRESQW
jgi:hypothetical protein